MDDSPDEAVPADGAAAASPPDANRLDIRARGSDAMLGRISFQKPEASSARRLPPLFECLFSYGPHAALAACLFGFVWGAASYFSGGQLPFYVMKSGLVQTVVPQESVELAEMLRTAQKMAEDIRFSKPTSRQCTPAHSAIAELAGKVEHMQRDSAAQLSHFIERFDRMEHQIAAVAANSQNQSETRNGSRTTRQSGRRRDFHNGRRRNRACSRLCHDVALLRARTCKVRAHRKADASGLRGEAVDYHTVENRNKRKAMRRNKLAQDMKAIMQRGQQSLVNLALSERSTSSDPRTLAATDLAAAGETQPEVA